MPQLNLKPNHKAIRDYLLPYYIASLNIEHAFFQGHSIVGFFERFRQEVASTARSYRGSFGNRKSKISYN